MYRPVEIGKAEVEFLNFLQGKETCPHNDIDIQDREHGRIALCQECGHFWKYRGAQRNEYCPLTDPEMERLEFHLYRLNLLHDGGH